MRSRTLLAALSLAVLATACTNDSAGPTSTSSSVPGQTTAPATTTTTVTLPPEEEAERGIVEDVIDGDSISVAMDGAVADVRLLGVNAPEFDECYGPEARGALAGLVSGVEVVMQAGDEDTDAQGRLLRYVFIETAEKPLLVNQALVSEGAAVGLQNGHFQQERFKEIEGRAYASGKGMWGTFVCGEPDGGVPDRPQLRISEVVYDPEGPDEETPNGEWVHIVNESYGTVAVGGWVLRDESASNRYQIPAAVGLRPGDSLRIYTGCGTPSSGVLYWCADGPVWSNDGDTAILTDGLGNVVERYAYPKT